MAGPLNPTVQDGQLASDWAKDTGSALGFNKDDTKYTNTTGTGNTGDDTLTPQESSKYAPQSGSNASTPGLNLPGSWNGATTVGAERLYNDVGSVLSSAAETASKYLPASVTGAFSGTSNETAKAVDKTRETQAVYEPHTLPSQDTEGQQPLQGPMEGVGALPGGKDEVNVAVLPDDHDSDAKADPGVPTLHGVEPTVSAPTKTAYSATAMLSSAVNAASTAGETATQKTAEAYENSGLSTASGDSKPNPTSGGVGALPGAKEETGVAILPEERFNPDPIRSAGIDKNTELAAPYHPSSGPKVGTVNPPAHSLSAKAEEIVNHSDRVSEGVSKPSLMDKVKGQAKIVSGKLTSDNEKVEAGKAQKGGVHM